MHNDESGIPHEGLLSGPSKCACRAARAIDSDDDSLVTKRRCRWGSGVDDRDRARSVVKAMLAD
jgi:hypothetical protein